MEENWERAVLTALNGESDCRSARILTLDGAVKCYHGRLPPPDVLEKFQSLEHLSIANVGVSSLEKFPHLPKLQKLILSDNRIAGGLEFLVQAGLGSLRDLDLSNNRIQYMEDLAPLAQLKLVSLDLYECPVTKIEDYRSRVFGLIRSLKYLDKMDADENERPESDEEEEEDDDDEDDEEEEEDDPGSGEIDGEGKSSKMSNGGIVDGDGVLDEDEESDADEEEREIEEIPNGSVLPLRQSNGFRVAPLRDEDVEDEEDDAEEIDEQGGEEEDVVEVQEIENSDEDDVDEVDEDGDDDDMEEIDEEEDVELVSTGRLTSTDGEIDGHDHGEDDGEEDENGELGEEEELNTEGEGNGDDDIENEDGTEFLVQPIGQAEEEEDAGGSDFDIGDEDDESGEEEEEVDDEGVRNGDLQSHPSTSSQSKRKRTDEDDDAVEEEEEDDDEGVQNGDLQSHPSTSTQCKKKRNGEDNNDDDDDDDAEDEDDSSVDAKFRRRP